MTGKLRRRDASHLTLTFKNCAELYIAENWSGWSPKHREQWLSTLQRYAYPTLGPLLISEIKPSHIFRLLYPIWAGKRDTANRVRGRIETVIAKNIDIDDREYRNPAELTKQLLLKLPKRSKRIARHHPALPYAQIHEFMYRLQFAEGAAACALRYLVYSAARTSEVLGASWSEIDMTTGIWRIPGERMKTGEFHSVPLSEAAKQTLAKMAKASPTSLIFPNSRGGRLSNMAMLAVLKRLHYSHVTVHGFRASFATWAEECTDYPDGVREAALAHKYKDETIAAYQRGEKLIKRRALMQDWADYISKLRSHCP
jgi:integrase